MNWTEVDLVTTGTSCLGDNVLLYRPEFMDPAQATGLWWLLDPEDVQAVAVNAVCKSSLANWDDVGACAGWAQQWPYVFLAAPPSPERAEAAEDVSRQKEGLFGVGSVSGKSAFFMDNFGFGRGFVRKKRNFVADVIFRTVRCVNCFSSCWPSRRACSFRRAATVRASGSRRPLRPSRRAICTPTSGSASVRTIRT